MRFRDRAQGCNQDRTTRSLRPSENGLVKLDRALMMIELRLEPALQITLFLFIAQRRRTRLVENPASPDIISLLQQQLDRPQLRAVAPLRIAQE